MELRKLLITGVMSQLMIGVTLEGNPPITRVIGSAAPAP